MSDARESKQLGRLAMRHEGNFWNAYYAMPDTMDGAILLGSIAMRFVENNQERKTAFILFMREALSDIIEDELGQRPTFPEGPQSAPEHEKAGHS